MARKHGGQVGAIGTRECAEGVPFLLGAVCFAAVGKNSRRPWEEGRDLPGGMAPFFA